MSFYHQNKELCETALDFITANGNATQDDLYGMTIDDLYSEVLDSGWCFGNRDEDLIREGLEVALAYFMDTGETVWWSEYFS